MAGMSGEFAFHCRELLQSRPAVVHLAERCDGPLCRSCAMNPAETHHIRVKREAGPGVLLNNHHPDWCSISQKIIIKRVLLNVPPTAVPEDVVRSDDWSSSKKDLLATMDLEHKNIVKHYHAQLYFHDLEPRGYMVFVEHCQEDLLKHLEKLFEALQPIPVSNYGRQLLEGLDYIHSKRVVHKDIKPKNIFVKEEGTNRYVLKLGDFGDLTELLDTITGRNEISKQAGTLIFMSPEMLALAEGGGNGDNVGKLTDIYSFGCVLLKMVGPESKANNPHGETPRFFKKRNNLQAVRDYYHRQGLDNADGSLVSSGDNRIVLSLHAFLSSGGQVEVIHSPNVVVVRSGSSVFAVRVPLNADGAALTRWMRRHGYQNGWIDMEPIIGNCVARLPKPHHGYSHSASAAPAQHIRPTAAQLLREAVFKTPEDADDATLPEESLAGLRNVASN